MNLDDNNAIVTITDETVQEKSGTKNGKDWSIREQGAVIETIDRKQPIRLDLGKSGAPYKAGRYLLKLVANLNISQFGSVQMKRQLVLSPLAVK